MSFECCVENSIMMLLVVAKFQMIALIFTDSTIFKQNREQHLFEIFGNIRFIKY